MAFDVDLSHDALLSKQDVAARLGVSIRTLEKYMSEGEFLDPATHVFKRPRWTIRQLNAWLNDSTGHIAPKELLTICGVSQLRHLGSPSIAFQADSRVDNNHYIGGLKLLESSDAILIKFTREVPALLKRTTQFLLVSEDQQFTSPETQRWGRDWASIAHPQAFDQLVAMTPFDTNPN